MLKLQSSLHKSLPKYKKRPKHNKSRFLVSLSARVSGKTRFVHLMLDLALPI